MRTVLRNRTLSRRYIRNTYCAQEPNTFQTAYKKCVLCRKQYPFQKVHKNMYFIQKEDTLVADVMQELNNIKYGIYSFYVRHNLTVGFPRHCAQYGHYFIRQLSAATCCQFTVLTWPTVLTANWRGEVTTKSDER